MHTCSNTTSRGSTCPIAAYLTHAPPHLLHARCKPCRTSPVPLSLPSPPLPANDTQDKQPPTSQNPNSSEQHHYLSVVSYQKPAAPSLYK